MNTVKIFSKAILLILLSSSFNASKAMHKSGLRKRHLAASAGDCQHAAEVVPLLAPPAEERLFLGLCPAAAVLGPEEEWQHHRDLFVNFKGQREALHFGLRPILITVKNNSSRELLRDVVGRSASCTCETMPIGINSGERRFMLLNAPPIFADRATVFVTLSFSSPAGQYSEALVGVTLDQPSVFGAHTTRVMVHILPLRGPVDIPSYDSKEGKSGPNQDYFKLVREQATGSGAAAELGGFGIVARIDQTVFCSIVANYTFVDVVFTDETSLAQQLGHTPELAAPPSADSTPPSRTTSQSSSSNE
jgi:hypothetical protein